MQIPMPPVTILPLPTPISGPIRPLPPLTGLPTMPPVTTLPLPGEDEGPFIHPHKPGSPADHPIGVTTWGKLLVTPAAGAKPHTYNLLAPLVPAMPLAGVSTYEDAVRGARELLLAGTHPFNSFVVTQSERGWFAAGVKLDEAAERAIETPTGSDGGAYSWQLVDGPRSAQALVTDQAIATYLRTELPAR